MKSEYDEKLTVEAEDNGGLLMWVLPADLKEQVNAMSEDDRTDFLEKLGSVLTDVSQTLATVALSHGVFDSIWGEFHTMLAHARRRAGEANLNEKRTLN
jgi:hypothetical protein